MAGWPTRGLARITKEIAINIKVFHFFGPRFVVSLCFRVSETGIPRFRISENPKFRVSVFPCFRDSGIPRFRDSEIPGFRDSGFPGFRDSEVPRFRGSEVPRFRDPGIAQIPRVRDPGIPRFRDSEIPRFWDSGVPGFWGSGIGILRFRSPNIFSSLLYRGVVLVNRPLPPPRCLAQDKYQGHGGACEQWRAMPLIWGHASVFECLVLTSRWR